MPVDQLPPCHSNVTGRYPPSYLEYQHTVYQAVAVSGAFGFSHLEVRGANRTLCNEAADSQVCEYVRTWNANTLDIKRMWFQVRLVFHT